MELGQHWFQSPATQQAIAWTNDDLSSTEPSEKKFQGNFKWNSNISTDENACENVVYKMAHILFRP